MTGYPFVQAKHYTPGRSNPIAVVVIHDMEYPEKADAAEAVAQFFMKGSTKASAHYCVDNNSVVQCVKDSDVAWHAPGANHNGVGIEHAGYARQTTGEWLDAYGTAMLRDVSAPLVRALCDKYGIPKVWLSVADVKAGKPGVTSHSNVSLALRKSTHTDPGPNFPTDQFMAWVQSQEPEDDMYTDDDRARDNATRKATDQLVNADGRLVDLLNAIKEAVESDDHGGPGQITPEVIDKIAKAVNNEAAGRLKD